MRPTVGIDLDGVLCDIVGEFNKQSKKWLKKTYPQTHYQFEHCGWTEKEVNYLWNKIRHTYNFWETLNPLPNTKQLMRWQEKLNLIFITSRMSSDGGDVATQSSNWLERNYGIRDAFVVVTNQKGPAAKELGIEYFIDDKPQNCLEVQKHSKDTKVYVQNASYNLQFSGKGITRVDNVNEFLKAILQEGAAVSPPRYLDKEGQGPHGRKKPRLRSKR